MSKAVTTSRIWNTILVDREWTGDGSLTYSDF